MNQTNTREGAYVPRRRKFQSARLKAGEYDEKPWMNLDPKDTINKRKRWEKIIFWTSIGIGVVLGAAICAFEYIGVSTGTVSLDTPINSLLH